MQILAQFFEHFDALQTQLHATERLWAWVEAEDTTYVRWNQGKIRQPSHLAQATCVLSLATGQRHADLDITLTGETALDTSRLRSALQQLRDIVADVPEDPFLLLPTEVCSSQDLREQHDRNLDAATDAIGHEAQGLDLVGFYADGHLGAAFADSNGQRNLWSKPLYCFDFSIYVGGDKAVKSTLGGDCFDLAQLQANLAQTRQRLPALARPPLTIAPGAYRALLAPAAVAELLGLLSWNALSTKAIRTEQSALQRLYRGEVALDARVNLSEDCRGGQVPGFGPQGFTRQPLVALFEQGRAVGSLTCPRTAQEYAIATDGSLGDESPLSLTLAGATLKKAESLEKLGTGLLVSNMWYVNHADRTDCRMTGMTRFATFWVENGEIVAPLQVMRFDDSFYDLFGKHLEDLGEQPELLVDPIAWRRRSPRTMTVPSALVSSLRLTL